MIRQLPDNASILRFFDNSFNSDVQGRKTTVKRTNADEELKWENRIHYIDQDMSTTSGGIGIQSITEFIYYGIDRFQRARKLIDISGFSN